MSRDQANHERLIDEMAVALMNLRHLDDETSCILALIEHGFRAADIAAHLDDARVLARMTQTHGFSESFQ